jgi:hypothetical protein
VPLDIFGGNPKNTQKNLLDLRLCDIMEIRRNNEKLSEW